MIEIYQVFHDLPVREGNFAALTGLSGNEEPSAKSLTCCRLSHDEDNRYTVDCYQHGQRIQCCGHGLMAAAHALFRSTDHSRVEFGQGIFAERSADTQGELQTWLHLPIVTATGIEVPHWVGQLLVDTDGQLVFPVTAASSHERDGYLLLQLDKHAAIESLLVDLEVITTNTRQALLLWQIDAADPGLVRMRYLAPQYGNDEDAATGSALRVLGPLTGISCFTVIQCSSAGGRMTVRNSDDSVAISGNVRSVDSKELPTQWRR